MEVQWYPGHMAKALRVLEEYLPLVDVVIEVRDARIPKSSSNPELLRRVGERPRLVALNKADLADAAATEEWVRHLRLVGAHAVAIEAQSGAGVKALLGLAGELAQPRLAREQARGRRLRPARLMIAGIPNVGKSSLINRLTKRGSARTGASPGVTRGKQWVRISDTLELLDLPGVLWPKFDDPQVGFRLAMTGAISEQIYDHFDVARRLLREVAPSIGPAIAARFDLDALGATTEETIDAIGRRRGCLRTGGAIDLTAAADILLREYRLGNLGRLTLERAGETGGGERDQHKATDHEPSRPVGADSTGR